MCTNNRIKLASIVVLRGLWRVHVDGNGLFFVGVASTPKTSYSTPRLSKRKKKRQLWDSSASRGSNRVTGCSHPASPTSPELRSPRKFQPVLLSVRGGQRQVLGIFMALGKSKAGSLLVRVSGHLQLVVDFRLKFAPTGRVKTGYFKLISLPR